MQAIIYDIKEICRHNRDGSFETQKKRFNNLMLAVNQLLQYGYHLKSVHSFKPKHIEFLTQHWHSQNLASSTMKQRMAHLRWLMVKINKQNIIAKDNAYYNIQKRQHVTNTSKAKTLSEEQLNQINDPYVKISVQLQQAFGLRCEESIKFIPNYADQGDHIILKASWAKGSKARTIPIRTQQQRDLLNQAKALAGRDALIPQHLKYYQQRNCYTKQTQKAGLQKLHSLRHHYAQQRYQELTGWPCPVQGGPLRKTFSAEQNLLDRQARLTISKELGHERIQVVSIYIGS